MADRGAGCRHLWRLGGADLLSCSVAGLAGRRDRRLADRLALLAAARDRPLPSDALAAAQQRPRLLAGIAAILYWLVAICDMSVGFYLAALVYPGTSLLLVRSFAEHRAAPDVRQRIAIVENAWILGPLFLFNNLHAAHHERPDLAWYA